MSVAAEWYETVGKKRLSRFCKMIDRACLEGKQRGYSRAKPDVDEIFRVFRGDGIRMSDEQVKQAQEMYKSGMRMAEIAHYFGVYGSLINKIVKRAAE